MKSDTKIAICGLGYVGLPLAIRFAEANVSVLGLDIDQKKVNTLNNGESFIKHIDSVKIKKHIENANFEASTDFSRIKEVEAAIICVPTPLGHHREPDISYVLTTARSIAPYLSQGKEGNSSKKLIVLESTTYPGTTDTELREVLESISGLQAGKDFHLAYSPEREDPGRVDHSVKTIPKVMGGYTPECLQRCVKLYSKALDSIYPVKSTSVAEATKLTENIFRAVNIALVNELKVIYNEMGIDIWEVINAAATKPFGFMPFYPGPGLGGHCIPIDPFYLTWKAKEFDKHTRFIELAGEINTDMPYYVVSRILNILNTSCKAIKGSKILILGLAYKKNVDDDRESPSYKLWSILEKLGAEISYNDPYVPEIGKTREYPHLAGQKSVPISGSFDLILLATDHDEYKSLNIDEIGIPFVDTRNCVESTSQLLYKA